MLGDSNKLGGTPFLDGCGMTDIPKDLSITQSRHIDKLTSSESSPTFSTSGSYVARPNQVSTVVLHGVPIVCLYIDGKERLCLAQISNTLLKQYSYNEIHNRRVALGITCVQCTPVQLEILRRAGAMPISSRRCGMITMREAERLVKSFLEDNTPPKLPENFSFHVQHECGWGCDGHFEPSRYNSSRAKCIKCNICNMYFSPNKFIFHFHRTQDAKYNHPDAANFNSWRRHLKLVNGADENIVHAWEDVKAMFNGGSRKKIISGDRSNSLDEPAKKPRLMNSDFDVTKDVYQSPYSPFNLLSQQRKPFQFPQLNHSPPVTFGLPYSKDIPTDSNKTSPVHPPSWPSLHSMFPTYNFLWNNPFVQNFRHDFRGSMFSLKDTTSRCKSDYVDSFNDDESSSSAGNSPTYDDGNERFSAFRIVSQPNKKTENKRPTKEISSSSDESEEINITDDVICESITLKTEKGTERDDSKKGVQNKDVLQYSDGNQHDKLKVDSDTICSHKKQNKEVENLDYFNKRAGKSIFNEDLNNDTSVCPHNAMSRDESRDDIRKEVKAEMEIRKQMEREIQTLKDALRNELEQERQVRFSLQQKLKEAHDALHNFSCKMLASRKCDECTYKDEENSEDPKEI